MGTGVADVSRVLARHLADRALELPPLPATAAEVLSLCQQESTDAAKVSAVIHRDPTLASNVLRVANSAANAGQVQCSSLQQAVSRLGMQVITEIAMAVAVRGRMFANPRCAQALAALWQHSVLTGFFCKEIARLRRRNVEIAFLAGLLHDIGKAVLWNGVDRWFGGEELAPAMQPLLAAIEEQHVAAGVLLTQQWKLPEQLAEAIQCHHAVDGAKRFADLAMTVCLADVIAHFVQPSPNVGAAAPAASTEAELRQHPVLVGLNIYPDQLQALLALKDRALQVTEGLR